MEFDENLVEINEEINQPISQEEILKATKNLKKKSSGSDNVLNEHIKSTIHVFLPIYLQLFDLILDTGIVPENGH